MSVLFFTRDHEWVRLEPDGTATVGITDYAQEQLGDIVYVELPETGCGFAAGGDVAVVESVKAVGEINMPVDGKIVAVNDRLNDEPELVNSDPVGDGWLFKLSLEDPTMVNTLMDEDGYQAFIASL